MNYPRLIKVHYALVVLAWALAFLIHAFTVIGAFNMRGIGWAYAAFILPGISEFAMVNEVWANGLFQNYYGYIAALAVVSLAATHLSKLVASAESRAIDDDIEAWYQGEEAKERLWVTSTWPWFEQAATVLCGGLFWGGVIWGAVWAIFFDKHPNPRPEETHREQIASTFQGVYDSFDGKTTLHVHSDGTASITVANPSQPDKSKEDSYLSSLGVWVVRGDSIKVHIVGDAGSLDAILDHEELPQGKALVPIGDPPISKCFFEETPEEDPPDRDY